MHAPRRESIARCCDAAVIRKIKKRKRSKEVKKFLADTPYIKVMELKINMGVDGGSCVVRNNVVTLPSWQKQALTLPLWFSLPILPILPHARSRHHAG